ncbi:MAG: hypothetical protein K0Q55_2560 [Verrucomicrobia bacterium]|jgi:hypothetical protein|nr:hypothetical protein [Verrucomicrobiota bacterium]
MDTAAFEKRLRSFMESPSQLMTTIAVGTFLGSVTPVPKAQWVSGLVPRREGRWNLENKPAKYFADSTALCLAELIGLADGEIGECTYECWQVTGAFPAFDVRAFPSDLLREFFMAGGTPSEKWHNSHLLLQELDFAPESSSPWALVAPSPYGMALGISGYTLATDPSLMPLKLIRISSLGGN